MHDSHPKLSATMSADSAQDAGSGEALLHEILDNLKLLVREPSMVGHEQAFFRVLRRELEKNDVSVQALHGVLVAQGDRHSACCAS